MADQNQGQVVTPAGGGLAGTWWRAYSADETPATIREKFQARQGRAPEKIERLACGMWVAGPLTAEEAPDGGVH